VATQVNIFSKTSLELDPETEVQRITTLLKKSVNQEFHRQGGIVGISGGIDSAVVLALCVRAFGADRVIGVLMPEKDSSPESVVLAQNLAKCYRVRTVTEDISCALEGFGSYKRRDEAVKRLIPQFNPDCMLKIVLPDTLLSQGSLNVYQLVVTDSQGREYRKRLPLNELRQIVAASNFKQRSRMSMLYYHAEINNYAVIGTANKNEHDLGFFVKYGDGGVDVSPIGHLFKTQVYMLARYLQVPEEIQKRTPTTDTYPGGGSQEEFFFRVPFDLLDTIWLGYEQGVPVDEISKTLDLDNERVERVIRDIISKQRATTYLRAKVSEVEHLNHNE
jgi:NAD+ synthase